MAFKRLCKAFLVVSIATGASSVSISNAVPSRPAILSAPTPLANCGRDELKAHDINVSRAWPTLRKAIVEGRGSRISRTPEDDMKLEAVRGKYPSSEKAEKYIQSKLDWSGLHLAPDKRLWEEGVYDNTLFAQFRLNEHPYHIPPEATHWLYWLRVPAVTRDLFMPLSHETVPDPDFLNPKRVAALTNYIKHYDLYGWSGTPEYLIKHLRPSSLAHPTDHVIWTDVSGQKVTRVQGAQAIRWAGRHIAKAIQAKFPPGEYEVLFNRSPERLRTLFGNDLDHIHVFVLPKEKDSDAHSKSSYYHSLVRSNFNVEGLLKLYRGLYCIP
ncbi:hypothetical protein Pst134EA_019588 [Puccinia striiformis f. sp. tritici]|uniref:Uncharacterized protein n=1 Tax=Puccinia striiformis TaxID=27350 RepID=A0A2S4VVS3_9BASI|nr:hypothetical protein Pst134EA_019588 [Puccinia striiformis f. sp. tritici]KAH9459433.1 hypothetical protein Pst134EA_019588 [Puccinia striiformis f. sp. tritici]POW13612.1 hypothetical protein PSTT_03574 [Puccinia striiformis]